jgi:hypothetical protein
VPRSAPWPETALVAAAAARRGRWLVTRAPVVAAGASSGVCTCEWHRDAEDEAGKQTGDELAPAEPRHAGSPPLRVPQPRVPQPLPRDAGTRNGSCKPTPLPTHRQCAGVRQKDLAEKRSKRRAV